MATSKQHAIDVEKLSASTRKELEMLSPLSGECCIYRVPDSLRRSNEQHYTPQVVSIGPIHHGKQELRAMEEHKLSYLRDFLQLSQQVSLEEYFQLIEMKETRLRDCYVHVVELNSESFVKMVLVDAAFVVMMFLRKSFKFRRFPSSIERVFQKPKMIYDIRYDMVLLENQLPFFILEDLYKLSKIHSTFDCNIREETAVITLAYKFLKSCNIIYMPPRNPPSKPEHLLALLRICLKPENWNPRRKATKDINNPSIKELYQAGVQFRVGSKENMFDIKFQDGVLEIPPLSVGDDTELVFRNLQAFEVSHYLDDLCCDYFIMMHRFTMASADVELLVENRIIENRLPNAQRISTVFHDLLSGNCLNRKNFGYSDVINGLNAYYAVRWNRWKATWKHKHFKAPWAIFSFGAALLLLLLTIVQTVGSMLQVT